MKRTSEPKANLNRLDEIRKTIEELEEEEATLKEAEYARVLSEVKNQIKFFGFTAYELGLSPGKKPTYNQARYRNTAMYQKGDLMWSGLGRRPDFVKMHLASGGKLDDLLVKKIKTK